MLWGFWAVSQDGGLHLFIYLFVYIVDIQQRRIVCLADHCFSQYSVDANRN